MQLYLNQGKNPTVTAGLGGQVMRICCGPPEARTIKTATNGRIPSAQRDLEATKTIGIIGKPTHVFQVHKPGRPKILSPCLGPKSVKTAYAPYVVEEISTE